MKIIKYFVSASILAFAIAFFVMPTATFASGGGDYIDSHIGDVGGYDYSTGWESFDNYVPTSDYSTGWESFDNYAPAYDYSTGWESFDNSVPTYDYSTGWESFDNSVPTYDYSTGWESFDNSVPSVDYSTGWQSFDNSYTVPTYSTNYGAGSSRSYSTPYYSTNYGCGSSCSVQTAPYVPSRIPSYSYSTGSNAAPAVNVNTNTNVNRQDQGQSQTANPVSNSTSSSTSNPNNVSSNENNNNSSASASTSVNVVNNVIVNVPAGGANNNNNTPALNVYCQANPSVVNLNQYITWTATASGGNGGYSYSWNGTDGLYGNGSSIVRGYGSTGQKYASVTVTSGNQSSSATCYATVNAIYGYQTHASNVTLIRDAYAQAPGSGVYLNQVPATGIEMNWKIALFAIGLITWSGLAAIVMSRKRKGKFATATTVGADRIAEFKRLNLLRK